MDLGSALLTVLDVVAVRRARLIRGLPAASASGASQGCEVAGGRGGGARVGVARANAIPAPPKVPAASTELTAVSSFRLGFLMPWSSVSSLSAVWTEDHHCPHRALCIH